MILFHSRPSEHLVDVLTAINHICQNQQDEFGDDRKRMAAQQHYCCEGYQEFEELQDRRPHHDEAVPDRFREAPLAIDRGQIGHAYVCVVIDSKRESTHGFLLK